MEDKEKKDLTEEERVGVKKIVSILAKFVLDEIEQEKKRANSNNNDTHTKELTRKLAGDLHGAFVWSETKEGHNYWKDVHGKLRRIAEEGF